MIRKSLIPFPKKIRLSPLQLHEAVFTTPLGNMQAVADEHRLYMLEFLDCKDLGKKMDRLQYKVYAQVSPGRTPIHDLVEDELQHYFAGDLRTFSIPLAIVGTPFQKEVWNSLRTISFGQTWSYSLVARSVERPTAVRAVARINSFNRFAIVIPCHRVVNANGALGGYNSGLKRKQWLLSHESHTLMSREKLQSSFFVVKKRFYFIITLQCT